MMVKICGITALDDALACVDAGADAIGFNFWPRSKRYISLGNAVAMRQRLPKSLRTVGVFVNPTAEQVETALASGAIDVAQLHGDESPEFCRGFSGRYWKGLRLDDASALARVAAYECELMLVDSHAPGYGGSGERADVELARRAAGMRPVLLAGGLAPENVAEAIAAVRPFGVDVASGVEREPGVKDWIKVAAFVSAAKQAVMP
jgi:phosphoribosylanthranilate isomerase